MDAVLEVVDFIRYPGCRGVSLLRSVDRGLMANYLLLLTILTKKCPVSRLRRALSRGYVSNVYIHYDIYMPVAVGLKGNVYMIYDI
mgnify:CR=1 FL=1